jgi:hypothetical protein
MSYAYHRRLAMRESMLSRVTRLPILAVVWAVLLVVDCALWLIGWRWRSLRNASRLDW